ncbi:MAG TPA: dihydroorotate dehydrogenase-like protein [Acidimicrobiales bacterium]
MTDLTTRYLGLTLRSPLVASASPLTGRLDDLRRLDDAGVGAVVLPSLFEEQIEHEELELDRMLSTASESFGEATSFFPELDDYDIGPDRHLALVEAAKAAVSVPVIASLNGTSGGGWLRYARLLADAGADAIELNVYTVAADPTRSGAQIEDEVVELLRAVRATVDVPVAVKLSPFWSSLANLAVRLDEAGADGLVLFNRFYQPDLDLETLHAIPHLVLSTSDELRLPLRWIGLLRGPVQASLAATTGVHTVADVAKALLAGADVTMLASALLHHGPGLIGELDRDLRTWMAEGEYASVEQLRGSAAADTGPDPAAFERANYRHTLASWSDGR